MDEPLSQEVKGKSKGMTMAEKMAVKLRQRVIEDILADLENIDKINDFVYLSEDKELDETSAPLSIAPVTVGSTVK
jgi:hypothetical protein